MQDNTTMGKVVELCSSVNYRHLEAVLLDYVSRFEDEQASGLVPTVLDEATRAAGWTPAEKHMPGCVIVRALAAAKLQEHLPKQQSRPSERHNLSQTRCKLWEALVEGLLWPWDGKKEFGIIAKAFFEYGYLSKDEEKNLRDYLRRRFERLSGEEARRLYRGLLLRSGTYSEVAARTCLHAVVTHSSCKLLEEILPVSQ